MNINADNISQIRRYVDGELSAAETAAFEGELSSSPELQQAVEFEQHLRGRVARALRSDETAAPAGLRHAIEASLRAETTVDAVIGRVDGDSHESTQPGQASEAIARRVNNPARVNIFAAAATLALVTGAVLFGIFGPRIGTTTNVGPSAPVSQEARFYSSEHFRCARSDSVRSSKVSYKSPDEAADRLSKKLQMRVPIPDLSAQGYEFVGAGPCVVCKTDDRATDDLRPTAHLIYVRKRVGEPTVYASMFLVPVEYGVGLEAPQRGWRPAELGGSAGRQVVLHREVEFVAYLTCCDCSDIAGLTAEFAQGLTLAESLPPRR